MSEPAGGGDIPAMGSSPPETEPTTESEPQSEEASRHSEQPSASLSASEPPPASTFSRPVESGTPTVEVLSPGRPPTKELSRDDSAGDADVPAARGTPVESGVSLADSDRTDEEAFERAREGAETARRIRDPAQP